MGCGCCGEIGTVGDGGGKGGEVAQIFGAVYSADLVVIGLCRIETGVSEKGFGDLGGDGGEGVIVGGSEDVVSGEVGVLDGCPGEGDFVVTAAGDEVLWDCGGCFVFACCSGEG